MFSLEPNTEEQGSGGKKSQFKKKINKYFIIVLAILAIILTVSLCS
jgi:hypothetical protein